MRLTEVWPVNVAADHGGVIGTAGEKWPRTSRGTMYWVNGRGIVADGCGSTAVAAKLIANESAIATYATIRRRTCSNAIISSGMIGTRYRPPTPKPPSHPLKLTLNAKNAAIAMSAAAQTARSA